MKKMIVIQISALLLISGGLGGMFLFTDVYEEVQSNIVLVLCLSCMKLEVNTIKEYTFETANDAPRPDGVVDTVTTGPGGLVCCDGAGAGGGSRY